MDTQICGKCGGAIFFRYMDGRPIPMHQNGGCSGGSASSLRDPKSTTYTFAEANEDICFLTRCPKPGCNALVYFVRHNGGSVWLDDLGCPWPKHWCFDDSVSSVNSDICFRAARVDKATGLLGVVRKIKVEASARSAGYTILAVDFADGTRRCLYAFGTHQDIHGEMVNVQFIGKVATLTRVRSLQKIKIFENDANPKELEFPESWRRTGPGFAANYTKAPESPPQTATPIPKVVALPKLGDQKPKTKCPNCGILVRPIKLPHHLRNCPPQRK